MVDKTRVAVFGACGKMGQEVVRAVAGAADMTLVGAVDVVWSGTRISELVGIEGLDVTVEADFEAMLDQAKPQVVVDFAKPFVFADTKLCLERGVRAVIGTTGITPEEIAQIGKVAAENKTGAIVAPNFAIGAVLMMKFASEAAKYMPAVEIIELHHDKKADAPSGTAIKTSELVDAARKSAGIDWQVPCVGDPARGEEHNNVPIHSVRLPGLVAHQEVLFGGMGQMLSIRHDSLDRSSFMPGVLLAIRKVLALEGLVYGLDNLI